MESNPRDVIKVYNRIEKAAKRGTGMRLTNSELWDIWGDGAVRQAVETADYEDEQCQEGK